MFKKALHRLGTLSVSGRRKEQMYKTILLPQLSWGNWWTTGAVSEMFKVTSAVRRALGVIVDGARSLWLLLAGHWMDVAFTTQLHYVAAFFSAELHWRNLGVSLAQGQWGDAVSNFLHEWRFGQANHCMWAHPDGQQLNFSTADGIQKGLHDLRERWREWHFQRFLMHERHEAREIQASGPQQYSAERLKKASRLYEQATQEERGVMVAGGKSEELYERTRRGPLPAGEAWRSHCSLCGQRCIPCWKHAAWSCDHFALTRTTSPGDGWAQLLAWPLVGEDVTASRQRLAHVAYVRKSLRQKFGFQKSRRRSREANPGDAGALEG